MDLLSRADADLFKKSLGGVDSKLETNIRVGSWVFHLRIPPAEQ